MKTTKKKPTTKRKAATPNSAEPKSRICPHCGSILPRTDGVPETRSDLTERQRAVLRLIAAGLQNKEIAKELGISSRTAEFHRATVMSRLKLRSTAELTVYALANQLIRPS